MLGNGSDNSSDDEVGADDDFFREPESGEESGAVDINGDMGPKTFVYIPDEETAEEKERGKRWEEGLV